MYSLLTSIFSRTKNTLRGDDVRQPIFLSFSTLEQALIAKRLSFLMRSGIALHESLMFLTSNVRSKRKERVLTDITKAVQAGSTLSEALEKRHPLFDTLTVTVIRIGEHTGSLSDNLSYLAHELQKRHALKQKVLGALLYPFFVTLATVGVTALLVMFIFPKLMPIFSSLNITLPATTRTLIQVSIFLHEWWLVTSLVFVFTIVFLLSLRRIWETFRYYTDALVIHTPVIGGVVKLYNATQFCRTLRLTLEAGMSLIESITITKNITRNARYKKVYAIGEEHVTQGDTISNVLLTHSHLFPEMLPQMVETGENSGNLNETLGYLSEYYEAEIDDKTKNLSNSLEPILLIGMGLTVGIIAVSVITPIYEITRHMQTY